MGASFRSKPFETSFEDLIKRRKKEKTISQIARHFFPVCESCLTVERGGKTKPETFRPRSDSMESENAVP